MSGAREGHHGKDSASSGEPEGDPQTPGRKGIRNLSKGRGGGKNGGGAPQGGDRTGSQNLQRVESVGERRAEAWQQRAPGRGRGSPRGEAGGQRAHPQGGQVDVVQAAGGGWVAHGLRRERGPGAAHAPARLFRCRRRRFSPIGGSRGRTPPRLPRRTGRGKAGGKTDPPTDRRYRPRACNPSLPTLPRRRRIAEHRGGWKRERDASAPGSPSPSTPTPARRRRRESERRARGLSDRASLA